MRYRVCWIIYNNTKDYILTYIRITIDNDGIYVRETKLTMIVRQKQCRKKHSTAKWDVLTYMEKCIEP